MTDEDRTLLRASAQIRDRLVHLHTNFRQVALPDVAWHDCEQLVRKITAAEHRDWHRASRPLRAQLALAISTCRHRLEEALLQVDAAGSRPVIPSQREILQDLRALSDEFDEVRVDLKRGELAAVTDSFILEDISLGRFEIALDWEALGTSDTYEVRAMDPQPAASDLDTTHPHVQSNQLCEGEGRTAIRRALNQGRLLDFFVLVRQILHTYNPGSAYVRLEQWDGTECRDCGRVMSEDDRGQCERCEADVCCECSTVCSTCGGLYCWECIQTCQGCGGDFCPGCRDACSSCGNQYCQECLTDEKCSNCRESDEEEASDSRGQSIGGPPEGMESSHNPVQSVRVGYVAVLA
jgi:hypothetical protein